VSQRLYKAKSITGAQARVRQLEKIRAWYEDQCTELKLSIKRLNQEADILAKLAAKGPCSFNPLEAFAAEELRDRRLAAMDLNPDGSFKVAGK
jgi:hypothetical protein